MSTYQTSLAPQLNQVPEDAEASNITPSHGGITGHEYDMNIAHHPQPPTPTSSSPSGPVPRGLTPSHRRPVSMPPQAYNLNVIPPGPSLATPSSSDTRERSHLSEESQQRRHREDNRVHAHSSTSRSSRTNRILGDYTLSKTLGAGSMGKVKLATHNVTGEKVCISDVDT